MKFIETISQYSMLLKGIAAVSQVALENFSHIRDLNLTCCVCTGLNS